MCLAIKVILTTITVNKIAPKAEFKINYWFRIDVNFSTFREVPFVYNSHALRIRSFGLIFSIYQVALQTITIYQTQYWSYSMVQVNPIATITKIVLKLYLSV